MYEFVLDKDEKIELISDNSKIYIDDDIKNVSSIITNKRLLILDYPNGFHNSMEDLRIAGKMNYIRKKEIIGNINLNDIITIDIDNDYYVIRMKDDRYININDIDIIEYLKKEMEL